MIASGYSKYMRLKWLITWLAVLGLSLLVGCGEEQPSPTQPPIVIEPTTATAIVLQQPTPDPQLPDPTPITALSAVDIYQKISPSVAFIDNEFFTGSGVLIDGGYVVTNAHVLWPLKTTRIVFGDGSEYLDVPLVGWDLMSDLAVLGPIDTDLPPAELVDGEHLTVGSDVYLIGYPGEIDLFPDPSITRGLISRMREWEREEITYFQSDAPIVGGQSGGVFVSDMGKIVGISGFSFTSADFSVVASAADLVDRINDLIAGQNVDGLGDRSLPTGRGLTETTISLEDSWDEADFIIYAEEDSYLDLSVSGDGDVGYILFDLQGELIEDVDSELSGEESSSTHIDSDQPLFVQIYMFDDDSATFDVESSLPLVSLADADDQQMLTVGETYRGSIDYPRDIDELHISLAANRSVSIIVDSIMVDPFILLSGGLSTVEAELIDDDSGGGLFGTSAEIIVSAEESGTYVLTIESAFTDEVGGYIVDIQPTDQEAQKIIIVEEEPTDDDFLFYQSETSDFSFYYPAEWEFVPEDKRDLVDGCNIDEDACFVSDASIMTVTATDGIGASTFEQFRDDFIAEIDSPALDFNLISNEDFQTNSGLRGAILHCEYVDLLTFYVALVVADDGRIFIPSYFFLDEESVEIEDAVRESFMTISYDR